jgi:hypothetical protein
VIEDRRPAQRDGAGDVVNAGLVDPVAIEERDGGVDDALARLFPFLCAEAAAVRDRLRRQSAYRRVAQQPVDGDV